MAGKLLIIWDYDGPIGQVNATYPYKFDEQKIFQEIKNVDYLLKQAEKYGIKMVFACTGFTAEPGHMPYHIPDQIKKIFESGHEVASHSWRHEWFPYLEREQIIRSLTRSKYALEACIGKEGAVTGFIPPFNRPMSWYSKCAVSVGDRVLGPWYPGASLGSLIKIVADTGYKWCRVSYHPMYKRLFFGEKIDLRKKWGTYNHVLCVRNTYFGFDSPANKLVSRLINDGGTLVISGHPSGLSREREESKELVNIFLHRVDELQNSGDVITQTVQEYMNDESC